MHTSIPVIILAAGNSSRMYPLCSTQHKAMIELVGSSLLYRTIKSIADAGTQKIVVIVNPSTDQTSLTEELRLSIPNLSLFFVVQNEAEGMGEAVLSAKTHISEDQFFIIAPYHFSAITVMEECLAMQKKAVVCSVTTETPWEYGILEINQNKATGVIEKPLQGTEPSNQKIQACYLLNQEFLTILDKTEKSHYSFETALDQLMKQSEVGCLELPKSLPSLKYPWKLFDFQKNILDGFTKTSIDPTAEVASTVVLDDSNGKIVIAAGAKIGHATRIVGPTYIGKNVMIGDFCLIRESSVEADAVVGANTELVRSIILNKSSIHFGYLADSIIDKKVKIGAGLVTANKRLDRKEIAVKINDKKIPTGRKSLGIIAGEAAEIGIKVGTMPGVLIGPGSKIFPGSILFTSTAVNEVVK